MRRRLDEYEIAKRAALAARAAELERELEALREMARVLTDLAIDDAHPPRLWTGLAEATERALFETCRGTCDGGDDDPAGVYATPCVVIDGRVVRYVKEYLIGTRTRWGVVPEPSWGRAMAVDGVPERVIASCLAYLEQSLPPAEVGRAGPSALPMARRLEGGTWR